MKKNSYAYLRDNTLRILTMAETDQGMIVNEPLVFFLETTAFPQTIGIKALESLANFKIGIPHPPDSVAWKIRGQEVLKAMRLKAWKSFIKSAKVICISTEDERTCIKITPYSTRDSGFVGLGDKCRVCPGEPEALGRVILEAFDDCE